jgi:8-oxo-dGTP diphosphatase
VVTFAAGGLLTRDDGAVCLVHRPRYDDWVIPKGKLEPGETLVEAAVREVREETRCTVDCGCYAGRYQYDVDGPKGVFVWRMCLVEERPLDADDTDEVDERVWLSPSAALDRLTYANERTLVERVLAG